MKTLADLVTDTLQHAGVAYWEYPKPRITKGGWVNFEVAVASIPLETVTRLAKLLDTKAIDFTGHFISEDETGPQTGVMLIVKGAKVPGYYDALKGRG